VEMLQSILTVLIWFLCFPLVALILLQGGAGDLSSTFGGGGQLDSSLGVGASRKMGKLTGGLSVFFLLCVLVLAIPDRGSIAAYEGDDATGGGADPVMTPPAGEQPAEDGAAVPEREAPESDADDEAGVPEADEAPAAEDGGAQASQTEAGEEPAEDEQPASRAEIVIPEEDGN